MVRAIGIIAKFTLCESDSDDLADFAVAAAVNRKRSVLSCVVDIDIAIRVHKGNSEERFDIIGPFCGDVVVFAVEGGDVNKAKVDIGDGGHFGAFRVAFLVTCHVLSIYISSAGVKRIRHIFSDFSRNLLA